MIYFEDKKFKLFILISFTYLKEQKGVSLKSINFFNNEKNLLRYIENNGLNLMKRKNSIEFEKIYQLIDLIKIYLSGKEINLFKKIHELGIEISIKKKFPTDFSQKVIHYLTDNVNYGNFTTYSKIGNAINTKAYRAVGSVMKSNPIPLIIPCHRVIRKNGTIGGFMGENSENWQTQLKLKLLKLEGIKQAQLKK